MNIIILLTPLTPPLPSSSSSTSSSSFLLLFFRISIPSPGTKSPRLNVLTSYTYSRAIPTYLSYNTHIIIPLDKEATIEQTCANIAYAAYLANQTLLMQAQLGWPFIQTTIAPTSTPTTAPTAAPTTAPTNVGTATSKPVASVSRTKGSAANLAPPIDWCNLPPQILPPQVGHLS